MPSVLRPTVRSISLFNNKQQEAESMHNRLKALHLAIQFFHNQRQTLLS